MVGGAPCRKSGYVGRKRSAKPNDSFHRNPHANQTRITTPLLGHPKRNRHPRFDLMPGNRSLGVTRGRSRFQPSGGTEDVVMEMGVERRTHVGGASPNGRYAVAEIIANWAHAETVWTEMKGGSKGEPQWHSMDARGTRGCSRVFLPTEDGWHSRRIRLGGRRFM